MQRAASGAGFEGCGGIRGAASQKIFLKAATPSLTEPPGRDPLSAPTGQAQRKEGQPVGASIVSRPGEPVKDKPSKNFSERGNSQIVL